jgi:hypothetical protein
MVLMRTLLGTRYSADNSLEGWSSARRRAPPALKLNSRGASCVGGTV